MGCAEAFFYRVPRTLCRKRRCHLATFVRQMCPCCDATSGSSEDPVKRHADGLAVLEMPGRAPSPVRCLLDQARANGIQVHVIELLDRLLNCHYCSHKHLLIGFGFRRHRQPNTNGLSKYPGFAVRFISQNQIIGRFFIIRVDSLSFDMYDVLFEGPASSMDDSFYLIVRPDSVCLIQGRQIRHDLLVCRRLSLDLFQSQNNRTA